MDFATLSNEQLADSLRSLMSSPGDDGAIDQLQDAVQSLQVHRVELEMQNRTLQETRIELEHSVQRYSDLYDWLPISYVTLTPSGCIVEANLTAAEWLHCERPRLIGSYLRSYIDADDAVRLAAHLQSCRQDADRQMLEVTLRVADGSTIPVQLSSRATYSAERECRIRTAMTDISQLKQAQQQLQEINREQEAFNYSISHDLRAPLVTISNFARIVMSEHLDKLDEEGQGMLQRVESAALRLEEMLQQLLEYSRLGRAEMVMQTVPLDETVDAMLLENRCMIQYRKAEVTVDHPLPVVIGSRIILSQVLTNLFTNALKYVAPGEPPRVHISAEVRPTTVVVKVADHGIGIDPQHSERIFRIFERLHNRSTYPGSGVGLAIVRRAVERMRGRAWVESEPGKGSCFSVELPKA
jgi:two-component system, chemotaxis family, sensor kinase Cph1